MRRMWIRLLGAAWLAMACATAAHVGRAMPTVRDAAPVADPGEIRFATLDVFVDSGASQLAAYQVEMVPHADGGAASVVGLYGGVPKAFEEPPFYDPAALNAANSRLIIAAYSTAADVPAGRTRVARVAVAHSGTHVPGYSARLVTAAGPDGQVLTRATVSVVETAGTPSSSTAKGSL